MNAIEKMFHYENSKISIVSHKGIVWFNAKQVASTLGYRDPGKAIRQNVSPDDRVTFEWLLKLESNGFHYKLKKRESIYINESGIYCLIFNSRLETAKCFKRWITNFVLPSIRKAGRNEGDLTHRYKEMLTFKIESETDLHIKVIHFLEKRYSHSLFTITLGENQDSSFKRIDSFKKGYLKRSPDIIINNLHKRYSGFAVQLKTPKGNGEMSGEQGIMMQQYQKNGFKTLISNDYDRIIEEIIEYLKDVRIRCNFCTRKFVSFESLGNHKKLFHRIQ